MRWDQSLLRELLEAQRSRKSERLSKEQLALFELAWQSQNPPSQSDDDDDDDIEGGAPADGQRPDQTQHKKRNGRQAPAQHLVRERIVHDLAEKHCSECGRDLRLIEEETSERYEYIPGFCEGDRGRAPQIRLRLHNQDGSQTGAAHRKEHGERQLTGAGNRIQMG
jgi:hypothetical protein